MSVLGPRKSSDSVAEYEGQVIQDWAEQAFGVSTVEEQNQIQVRFPPEPKSRFSESRQSTESCSRVSWKSSCALWANTTIPFSVIDGN